LLVWLLALPILGVGLGWGVDRDVSLIAGDRILRGEWPYQDFWTLYAPGSGFAVAATFAVLGRELLAVHGVAVVLASLSVAAFYRLLRAVGAISPVAVGGAAVFTFAIWTPSPPIDSYAVTRLLLLVGFERVLAALRGDTSRPAWAAGCAFGLAAWFKHDVGAYAALGSACALWLAAGRGAWLPLRGLALGCAVFVLPACVGVALIGGEEAWQSLLLFPATDFASVRGEAYPSFWRPSLVGWEGAGASSLSGLYALGRAVLALATWGQAVLPELLFVGWLVQAVVRRRVWGGEWLAVACLPLFWGAAHVQQNTHLTSMGILCAVLLVQWRDREQVGVVRGALLAVAAALAVSFVAPSAVAFARMSLEQRDGVTLDLPGARGIRVSRRQAEVYHAIVPRLRREVPVGEAIHVSLARHDAVIIGDPRFYFLADRSPATRYHELHPGVVDRDDVQREMVDALERAGVRFVVRWRFGWPDSRLDEILARRRRDLPAVGARRLDDYLNRHFEVVERHGEFDLLRRRSAR
jgi:hypothetical protein